MAKRQHHAQPSDHATQPNARLQGLLIGTVWRGTQATPQDRSPARDSYMELNGRELRVRRAEHACITYSMCMKHVACNRIKEPVTCYKSNS